MNIYTNPRMKAEFSDWPYGPKRVKAIFEIEQGKKGERAVRITENPKTGGFNKPKKLTFSIQQRIVDGSDGKTYIAVLGDHDAITIMNSDLKYQFEYISDCSDSDRFNELTKLFEV